MIQRDLFYLNELANTGENPYVFFKTDGINQSAESTNGSTRFCYREKMINQGLDCCYLVNCKSSRKSLDLVSSDVELLNEDSQLLGVKQDVEDKLYKVATAGRYQAVFNRVDLFNVCRDICNVRTILKDYIPYLKFERQKLYWVVVGNKPNGVNINDMIPPNFIDTILPENFNFTLNAREFKMGLKWFEEETVTLWFEDICGTQRGKIYMQENNKTVIFNLNGAKQWDKD